MKELAEKLKDKEHIFIIGRGLQYPTAMEAALKIKEVADIIIPVHDPTIAKMAEIPYRYRSGGK